MKITVGFPLLLVFTQAAMYFLVFSFVDDPTVYDLALGTNSLDDYSENLQFRGVSQIYLHPQYDFFIYEHDLALLKLSEPVQITDWVRMACLPTANMDQFFPTGTVCTATGFGQEGQPGILILFKTLY